MQLDQQPILVDLNGLLVKYRAEAVGALSSHVNVLFISAFGPAIGGSTSVVAQQQVIVGVSARNKY